MPHNIRKTSKMILVAQWLYQIGLSCLFLLFIYKDLPNFVGGGQGAIMWILPLIPFASIAGVVIGDISLYRGEKLIKQAVFTASVFSLIGIVFGFFLEPALNSMPWLLDNIVAFGPMVILPVIGYNVVSSINRELLRKKKLQQSKQGKKS
jgi:hypothetical protein